MRDVFSLRHHMITAYVRLNMSTAYLPVKHKLNLYCTVICPLPMWWRSPAERMRRHYRVANRL